MVILQFGVGGVWGEPDQWWFSNLGWAEIGKFPPIDVGVGESPANGVSPFWGGRDLGGAHPIAFPQFEVGGA